MWLTYHVTLCLLVVLDVAWCGHGDPPPDLPISEHEFPRSTVNPVPYPGRGLWKDPPEDIDVGFVPQKTYSQVRRTSRVVHLPQSDAIESASDVEEVINAPRLREVVKHTQIREVYEEEGFEDNAYDHAGFKKAAEHHSGYKKGDEPENKRWRRQRGKPKVDSQGQQSEVFGMKVTDKDDPDGEFEGKGDGAIEGKEVAVENDSKEVLKKSRGRGRYKFNEGGGEEDDGNRNYSFGRMMHTMDVKSGVDKMDDKGRIIPGKEKVKEWKKLEMKPRGNFLVNGYGKVLKNQSRKRESPVKEEQTGEDDVEGLVQESEESGSGQGSLEDSFGQEHSATDRPDKAEYLEAADEEKRLREEDAIRDEEIEQHYMETSADIAKDYIPKDRGIDHRKYPYYKTTKNKHSPLRYAMSSSEIPQKTEGGLEFYDSKDFYHCEEVKGPGDVKPVRQKDGDWAGAPRKGIFPRLSGLGDKIDCFKNKYWGKEPLDSPFFKEDDIVVVENKKRDTHGDGKEKSAPFEDSSGFYADIVGNIRNIEKGTFPATNFDAGGPLIRRPQNGVQDFDSSFDRPTLNNDRNRYENHRDDEESEDEDDDDRDERRDETTTETYPKYVVSAPVYEKVSTNPRPSQPLYKYKFLPVKTKRNHHHIILNLLPPVKHSKKNKKKEKSPPKNSYQVKNIPKPYKQKPNSYPLYPPLSNENQSPKFYAPVKYYPISPAQVAEYQKANVKLTPYPVKHQNYPNSQYPNRTPRPIPKNYATPIKSNEYQATNVKLTSYPVKHPLYPNSQNSNRNPRPTPNNYSTPIKSNEEYVNIFGMHPPPPNVHFKYQTLSLLAPNITTAKFRRPDNIQSAHASNVVRKYPMVDNMAQETYDVVAKVSNLTELQLKQTDVKLRVKRSRLYSDVRPVREDVDEDDEPKVIRKRKRLRKKEPWRNEEVAVDELRSRSKPRREEEDEESAPAPSSSGGSYDVREEVDDSVHPFEHRDYEFPEESHYSRESSPQVKKSKQYSTHNHQPDDEHVEENTSRQPEVSGTEDEGRSLKRKRKRKRKKPKQKHFWRNEESYEINEKEPNVEKYVEWRDLGENTEAPVIEKQMDKVDEVYNKKVTTVEKGVEDEPEEGTKRRRRPSKRGRIPKQRPRPEPEEKEEEEEDDGDEESRKESRRGIEATSRPYTTHGSLTDRINGWLSNNKDLEIISLDPDEKKSHKPPTEKNERRKSKPRVDDSDDENVSDEEASSSEQTEVIVDYPKVSRNNQVIKKPQRKGETIRNERGKAEESEDKSAEIKSKNSREKSTSEEDRFSVDKRRGEPKYKEVETKKVVDDDQKNNTHMTIHEEIRLTPLNAPPPIVLTPEEINAKLALLFKDQKYGSRYNAKEPQESVNTLRKLRPDDPDSDEKSEESSEEDIDASTTTSKPTTTTTTTGTTTTTKSRVRPLFTTRSRGQGSNDTKEVKSEPKQETLRSRTQFSQRARGRSRDSQTTTEKSEIVEKESQRTRTEGNQRGKVREPSDVKEVTRGRSRRPIVRSNAETTTQQPSNVARPRSRYRFTTTTKPTPSGSSEDTPPRTDGRKLSRKGRDKSTTEFPAKDEKDQKKEGSGAGEETKLEDVSTVAPSSPTTTKAPKRIFLFNRPKPTTTIKPDVTTKRVITIERPKKPVDILSKVEATNAPSTLRQKGISKIPNADIRKVEGKTPVVVMKTTTKVTQNRVTKLGDKGKELEETKNDKSKPRQLKNFETRKVTKEEIFTTSYTPQDDDDEEDEEVEEDDAEETDDEDDEYADESENDDVTYEPFEHPYFKYEQNNEQSRKVERFENHPTSGWGGENTGVNRNSIKGRLQKKGFLKPQESLARQILATDRTLTYIVDPSTRIGTWVEGRS